MTTHIRGLHHLTAIATDAQANIDFYAGLLGLRLVKKTVNFDDPSAYHLYYGDEAGSPGSIITFFYWPDAPKGRVGAGQATAIPFSVAPSALTFWQERLKRHGVSAVRRSRFDEEVLVFPDPDGIPIELVAVESDNRAGWVTTGVEAPVALRGMHTAELTVRRAEPTEALLTGLMGYRLVRRSGSRARFAVAEGASGALVDVIADPTGPSGTGAAGTIHHIAFRVPDDAAELAMLAQIKAAGFPISEVRDRDYFRSIYYRERGGILFEIATDVPGFAVDEDPASLGSSLKLPKQFQAHRAQIEDSLPALRPPQHLP